LIVIYVFLDRSRPKNKARAVESNSSIHDVFIHAQKIRVEGICITSHALNV